MLDQHSGTLDAHVLGVRRVHLHDVDDSLTYLRYDTRCYFDVQPKADMNQLNLLHRTDNQKVEN